MRVGYMDVGGLDGNHSSHQITIQYLRQITTSYISSQ